MLGDVDETHQRYRRTQGRRALQCYTETSRVAAVKCLVYGRADTDEKGIRCGSTLRRYSAENREITISTGRNEDNAKIRVEQFKHILTYKSALTKVEMGHPIIYLTRSAHKIWTRKPLMVRMEESANCPLWKMEAQWLKRRWVIARNWQARDMCGCCPSCWSTLHYFFILRRKNEMKA